jgi:hypothetical protein
MTLQHTEPRLSGVLRHSGVFIALAAAIAWGVACSLLHAPYVVVALGGLASAGLGFWLERAELITPETAQRKDFQVILAAGFGFFAVLGVGLVSLSCLLSNWYLLPRL